ncbi:putative pyridoxal reductase [Xylogone sp. PMI_703]|nr:putative pyridoxal reductase [Xylogone sp. PMI_703]
MIEGKKVGSTGYGLMGLSWPANRVSEDQALHAMKTALKAGANFWNGGEFYGKPDYNSLTLLNKYFTKYPEDADKVVINIKGALDPELMPDCSETNIRRSVDNCLKQLDGKKSIDIFECARVDRRVSIEETIGVLASLVKEGKIGAIGLSEVKAGTISRASKVHHIASVEVEFSLWSSDILRNGVASTCAELGIPVLAYCPLGRGMLTGQFQKLDDIPTSDWRRYNPRFLPGAFEKNLVLVKAVERVASQKGCSTAQLALAWIRSMSGKDGNPIFIPIPGSGSESRILENTKEIELTAEELSELNHIISEFEVTGERYSGKQQTVLEG